MAGRRPRRATRSPRRSQHFLRNDALARELVRDAQIERDDLVLDIGAGNGRLTEHLSRAAGRVLAIEVDPVLANSLRGRWTNVEVVVDDAAVAPLPREPFRVVANLPFHRTTDLLRAILDPSGGLVRADVVVDWHVAVRRALPWPSTVNGVYWSAFFEPALARRLPRSVFDLPPAVDAGVLVFRRRAAPLVDPGEAEEFGRFVAGGFRHGLGRVCRRSDAVRLRGRTPRDLDAHEWAALFRGLGGRR